jgi:putative flippase GtrA
MAHLVPRMVTAARSRFRTTVGRRFSRFAVAAVAAVAASQITLAVCLGVFGLPAGRSALAAWLAGAGTSYLVSRWAWERRGRPHLLKETLPFWVVAVGAAVVLTSTTKFANQRAMSMGLSHKQVVLFDGIAFLIANCVTFLTRFLIFHYVLFKDRGTKTPAPAAAGPQAGPGSASGTGDAADAVPVPSAGGPAGNGAGGAAGNGAGGAPGNGVAKVNGSAARSAGAAGRSRGHDPAAEPGLLSEPRPQR